MPATMGFARMLTGELTRSYAVDLAGHVVPEKHLALDVGHQIPEDVLFDDLLVLVVEFALMIKLILIRPYVRLQIR